MPSMKGNRRERGYEDFVDVNGKPIVVGDEVEFLYPNAAVGRGTVTRLEFKKAYKPFEIKMAVRSTPAYAHTDQIRKVHDVMCEAKVAGVLCTAVAQPGYRFCAEHGREVK